MPQRDPRDARLRLLRRVVGRAAALSASLIIALGVLPGGAPEALAATTASVAVADAMVKTSSPTKNYGTATTLQVRAPTPEYRVFLRFTVSGISAPVTAVKLRLFVTDPSPIGGQIYAVTGSWTETAVTWNNKPAFGASLGSAGNVTAQTWVEITMPAASFPGNGRIASASGRRTRTARSTRVERARTRPSSS